MAVLLSISFDSSLSAYLLPKVYPAVSSSKYNSWWKSSDTKINISRDLNEKNSPENSKYLGSNFDISATT